VSVAVDVRVEPVNEIDTSENEPLKLTDTVGTVSDSDTVLVSVIRAAVGVGEAEGLEEPVTVADLDAD
jgi:hypothetical protein